MTSPGFRALAEPLDEKKRRALREALRGFLRFQERLGRFPRVRVAPDATPIVSLYANGRLLGCCASSEGHPGERLARAFLLALGDTRFGGIDPGARRHLVAQIAYPRGVRRVSLDAATRVIAPGAHGLALSTTDGLPTLLVPEVAREHELDAEGLLVALEQKAGLTRARWHRAGLALFETERVVARQEKECGTAEAGIATAVAWLAARVGPNGEIAFGHEPRADRDVGVGPMLHGRAAVVVQALAAHRAGKSALSRARRWLDRAIQSGLGAKPSEGWPKDAAMVAGTLALAKLAGIDVGSALRELAGRADVSRVPWHAAQVACALGADAPDRLWRACIRSLDDDPRAPWVALAASVRGDTSVLERVAPALAAQVREHGPHRGGVGSGSVPEVALTALTVEALSASRLEPARRALGLARTFVKERQIVRDELPEAPHPAHTLGAFPLSPIHGFLRADVTAHAVLALRTPVT
jgi:AMMECR1 domain-containing protein